MKKAYVSGYEKLNGIDSPIQNESPTKSSSSMNFSLDTDNNRHHRKRN